MPSKASLSIVKWVILVFVFAITTDCLAQQRIWGVNGDPDAVDYAGWEPKENNVQMNLLKELGATYYRFSFHNLEEQDNKRIFGLIHDSASAQRIKLLPIIFKAPRPDLTYQENWQRGYDEGQSWARYVLGNNQDKKLYEVSHWELGNETSTASAEKDGRQIPMFRLVNRSGRVADGSDPMDWDEAPEFKGQAFQAMAGVLRGLYWGIKDTYKDKNKEVKILFGDVWRAFGYIEKIKAVGGENFFPGDILSWHWYTPSFGSFTKPFKNQWDVTRSPYDYAASIRPGLAAAGTKIDIWMTEVGREDCPKDVKNGCAPPKVGGSAMNRWNPDENWSVQSAEMTSLLQSLVGSDVPQIKAIFAYELYDKYLDKKDLTLDEKTYPEFTSQGFYGLVQRTKNYPRSDADLTRYIKKPVFDTFQSFIKSYP
jgi:hypothetical protein